VIDRRPVRTIVITGSAGGIGSATRRVLEAEGHRVIGVDVRDAEVIADLGTPEGRARMVTDVESASGGAIDGLVAGAGVNGQPGDRTLSINYFGAIGTLAGLRPLLHAGNTPSAVAISSNSVTTQAGFSMAMTDACDADDEAAARRLGASDAEGLLAYPAAKLALARWVRRQAITADWIGAGIRLNAIAPGLIRTPMTAAGEEFILSLGDIFPIPIGRPGRAEEVGTLLAYLLGPDAGFFVGSVIFMDGGTDAALRTLDWPAPRP
jgi:NAD(P)-dependent dehydrogenase (short-subunit alcohol dehydrogenase family)